MRKLLTLLLLVVGSTAMSQIVSENAFNRIEVIDTLHVKVTQLQPCSARIKVTYDGKDYITTRLPKDSSITITLACCGKVKTYPVDVCIAEKTCQGEVNTCLYLLPVRVADFRYIQRNYDLELHTKFAEAPNPRASYYVLITLADGSTRKEKVTFTNLVSDYFIQKVSIK